MSYAPLPQDEERLLPHDEPQPQQQRQRVDYDKQVWSRPLLLLRALTGLRVASVVAVPFVLPLGQAGH